MYDIRFCQADEIDKLQEFIYSNWNKDHIFTKHMELLKWQHYDKVNGRYNFIVAYNKIEKAFDAILGFIPVNHYGEDLSNGDIWLAIWKINEEKTKGKLSGIDLLYYLRKQMKPNSIGAIGVSDTAANIYKILGYKTGILNHYYLLNSYVNQFVIADVKANSNNVEELIKKEDFNNIRQITDIEELKHIKEIYRPLKSPNYIRNRYLNHPVYKYVLYGIYQGKQLICAFITRKIKMGNAYCIRIVDIYGKISSLSNISEAMQQVLRDENAEYIDCINFGIDESVFYRIGFKKRDSSIIIPNYFEPFMRKNAEIQFAYKSNYDDYIIFKADSDQDRPNAM